MSRDNGEVTGSTRILDNGSNATRFNIVLLAEGFTDDEQDDFDGRCDEFVAALQTDKWLRGLVRGFNVHRVNVESDESGTDDPEDCDDGTGTERDTFFDSSLCTGFPAIRRLMHFDSGLAAEVCDQEVPEWDAAIVVVNSAELGGAGGRVAITTLTGDWTDAALHEFGHSAFGLADEYPLWSSCDEEGHDHPFPWFDPWEPNVTRALHGIPPTVATSRADVKWGHLIDPETTVPTQRNPDCGDCPPSNNPLATSDEIGLFEGAQYHHCDLFRPAFDCRMKNSGRDFCLVCIEAAHRVVRPHLPDGPSVVAEIDQIEMGDVCSGETRTLDFRIANLGDLFGDVAIETSVNQLAGEVRAFGVPPGSLFRDGGLIPGQAARVVLTFGPLDLPATLDQREIDGDVRVMVDDTAQVILPFSVTVHRPRAEAQITPAVLDFGDVAVGLTMFRRLRVRSDAGPCPLSLEVFIDQLTGPFAFVETIGDEIETEVAGNRTRDVYLRFTAPDQPGTEFDGQIRVRTSDPNNASMIVPLRARAVAHAPVDSVLVVDRSGSMQGETGEEGRRKIDHAIFAMDLYTSLLRDSDGIGLVRFNDHSTEEDNDLLVGLTAAGAGGRDLVWDVLEEGASGALQPAGSTSIGAGLLLGSDVLDSASSEARAVVVLTDGRENQGTTIEEAKAEILAKTPAQHLFAVGLGLDQLIESVISAASETGGVAVVTGDVADDKEFLLQKLFVQILSDEGDWSMLEDPVQGLDGGESAGTTVRIGETDLLADFIVTFTPGPFPKYLRSWLKMPGGVVLNPENHVQYPGLQYAQRESHLFYRVPLPLLAADPQAHLGNWEVWVANDTDSGAGSPLTYSVIGRAFSNLRMSGRLRQRTLQAGSRMEVTLKPTLFGVAAEALEPVRASVILPDLQRRNLELARTKPGNYRGVFRETEQEGPYHFDCMAVVPTPSGIPVTRTRYLGGVILPPPKGKGPLPGLQDYDGTLLEGFLRDLLALIRRRRGSGGRR